jgi:hypothetical protein
MRPMWRFSEDYQMTPKQEEALRDYLQEAIVPLIEEVLVKKLGQAMTFAKEELAEQPAQQEPVAWITKDGEIYKHECWPEHEARPLVFGDTSPPAQRTWVSLTEDEISLIVAECSLVSPSDHYFAEAIEAKLKEKNT